MQLISIDVEPTLFGDVRVTVRTRQSPGGPVTKDTYAHCTPEEAEQICIEYLYADTPSNSVPEIQ